jgi:hypothetical protein
MVYPCPPNGSYLALPHTEGYLHQACLLPLGLLTPIEPGTGKGGKEVEKCQEGSGAEARLCWALSKARASDPLWCLNHLCVPSTSLVF